MRRDYFKKVKHERAFHLFTFLNQPLKLRLFNQTNCLKICTGSLRKGVKFVVG